MCPVRANAIPLRVGEEALEAVTAKLVALSDGLEFGVYQPAPARLNPRVLRRASILGWYFYAGVRSLQARDFFFVNPILVSI
ncbi:hypothetical protein [Oxynema aestuarii]|uniref:Uncharacterized protein n=1 Tax=Oxynema aestuarii AP17 TaxID=2064643 RepID=A0A6H1U0B9_9CYAN|nr:hypothetical protein [Oxynema aestuarii]QIZ71886.1 hypothetical protein HCG48_15935 [Oxynema aestuarii AP17]